MVDTSNLVQWQKVSPNGFIYPWFVHKCLDVIEKWPKADKVVLETGGGRSTAWWRDVCKWVDTIEASEKWAQAINEECAMNNLTNGRVCANGDIPDGVQDRKGEFFALIPTDKQYDIVVVDGIWRYEMLEWAIKHFGDRKGIIIADNWQQSFVWMSPPSEELMKPYKRDIYEQDDHTDNDGVNKWKTAVFFIN